MNTSIKKSGGILGLIFCFSTLFYFGVFKKDANDQNDGGIASAMGPPENPSSVGPHRNLADSLGQRNGDDTRAAAEAIPIESLLAQLAELPYGKDYDQLVKTIAAYYGENDPEAGKRWLFSLGSHPANGAAFRMFGGIYARYHGLKSLSFYGEIEHEVFPKELLNQVAPSPSRDAAVASFSKGIVGHAPHSAMRWANGIGDDHSRRITSLILLDQIKKFDPNLAADLKTEFSALNEGSKNPNNNDSAE